MKLHGNQQDMKEMRRDRESRFQASHVFTPGRSGSGSQAVIQIAVQQPLYKLTITYWLLPNNIVKFIIFS